MFQDRAQAAAPDLYAYKTADESVTSSDVLQADDSLAVAIKANRKYVFNAVLFVSGGNAGDFKVGFTGPAVNNFIAGGIDSSSQSATTQVALGGSQTYQLDGGGAIYMIHWSGGIEPSADGTFTVVWAQNVSNGTPTVVHRGSYLAVWRLA